MLHSCGGSPLHLSNVGRPRGIKTVSKRHCPRFAAVYFASSRTDQLTVLAFTEISHRIAPGIFASLAFHAFSLRTSRTTTPGRPGIAPFSIATSFHEDGNPTFITLATMILIHYTASLPGPQGRYRLDVFNADVRIFPQYPPQPLLYSSLLSK